MRKERRGRRKGGIAGYRRMTEWRSRRSKRGKRKEKKESR